MAYRHYHVIGLVLGHLAHGESNRLYQVLTPDFGLIRVLAQGVRLEKSKLRYNFQTYHLVDLDLVRGREYWRLTGATKIGSANDLQVAFGRRLGSVLLKLIHGEEASAMIFSDLKRAWDLLIDKPGEIDPEDLEIFVLIRLFANLGYLAPSEISIPILVNQDFSWSDVSTVSKKRGALIRVINASFLSSGL